MWSLIDHHLHHESPLHRWHVVPKLGAFGVLVIAIACLQNLLLLAVGLVLSMVALAWTNLPARVLWKHLRGLVAFLLLFAVLLALTQAGEPAFRIGPLSASSEGLRLAARLGSKALSLALLAAALVSSTPFVVLCHGLRRLGCPARLVQVILLTYRMNYALGAEVESMQAALAGRGFRWRWGTRSLQVIGTAVGALLARSLDRTDRLYHAMLARGYDGQVRCEPLPALQRADRLKLAIAVMAAVLLAVGEWVW
jgi:cobalt/nickel transport system permease protein